MARYPKEVEHLKHATIPGGVGDDLKDVFTHPLAARLVEHCPGLTQQDVERITAPMRRITAPMRRAAKTEPAAAPTQLARGRLRSHFAMRAEDRLWHR